MATTLIQVLWPRARNYLGKVGGCLFCGEIKTWSNKREYRAPYGAPKLGPPEVTTILRNRECSQDLKISSIRAFDSNQLPSNSPVEDRLIVGRCLLTTGLLFGVFDGHGGDRCADIVSRRLLDYLALSILPYPLLKEYVNSKQQTALVEILHAVEQFSDTDLEVHSKGLMKFAKNLLSTEKENHFSMQDAMTRAFTMLDDDLSDEILNERSLHTLAFSVMGCCACVVHIDNTHLHIATTGDCKAVLGVVGDDNSWASRPLTKEHNSDNVDELKRIFSEHPKIESNVVIRQDRLLGQLAPLRAFGDFNYKWKSSMIKDILVPVFGPTVIPPNYYTPPYLTARPEVIHHCLTPRDKFLILASDGLWEQMMPHKVVKFVGQHMSGRHTLDLLKLPRPKMKLQDVYNILVHRQKGLQQKPIDSNAATHLIRTALGHTEYGVEHSKLAAMLTLPSDIVRNFRDDISIIVIYFDSEYLRQSPAA